MAYEIPGFMFTLEAGADLSLIQFYCVVVAADGQVDAAGAGVDITGVLQNKPDAAGKAATIMTSGVTKASAGAAITRGAIVMSAADGQVIAATATNQGIGFALETAGGADEIIAVHLKDLGTQ